MTHVPGVPMLLLGVVAAGCAGASTPGSPGEGGAPQTSSTGEGGAPQTSSTGEGGAPQTSGAGGSGGASAPTVAVAYQIDAAHTGRQPLESLSPPLMKRWSVDLGGAISYPLIVGGRVFVTVRNETSYGTRLFAVDQETGDNAWGPVDIPGTYFWSAAAYDDGKVFVVNFDGVMSSFDAATGSQLWTVQLPGQYAFSSAPSAENGVVYVGGAGSGGTLYAVDEMDGSVRWTASVENGDNSSPAVSASGVYVAYACNQIYGFALGDGAPLWHHSGPCEGGGGKTAALFADKLYARDFMSDVILDAQTGEVTGTFDAGPIPAFDGDLGFFVTGGTLQAKDLVSLTNAWSFEGDGQLDTAPIVAGGYVYVGSGVGTLYALDARSGAQVWSDDSGAPAAPDEQNVSQPLTGMAVAGGALLVPRAHRLSAYW